MTLRLDNISSGYGRAIVVRDVSLSVADGETVTVLGPNGAGKSTLLKTVAGVLRPVGGSVAVGDRKLNDGRPVEH
ncbi:MAG: ATP-binding cassette domain-containing protein, partial [Ilumatobacter fluminis]